MQLDKEGKRHLVRYKSRVWSTLERNQDLGKYKCKALLLTLKKLQLYLYSIRFTIEIDTQTLIAQLQRSVIDLLDTFITRQLTLLNLQNFNIIYILEKKNIVANTLLYRLEPKGQTLLEELEEDIKDFIKAYLNATQLTFIRDNQIILTLLYRFYLVDLLFNK